MRALIVEDDKNLAWEIKLGLEENGYAVDLAFNGLDGEEMALAYSYDIIILDIMIPEKDGFSVCRALRDKRIKAPILMLTARQQEDDRVCGLDSGADDYLVKPFSYPEFYARVRTVIRRAKGVCSVEIRAGKLKVDTAAKKVFYNSMEVSLTAKEYAILEYLVFNKNGVVTREMLEEHIWDSEYGAFSNVINVLISRIRRKLCPDDKDAVIRTVTGLGYTITDEQSNK